MHLNTMHSTTVFYFAIGVCATMATFNSISNVLKPFGPQMCRRQCLLMVGCSLYAYSSADIACYLTNIYKVKAPRNIISKQEMIPSEYDCAKDSRLIRTKSKRILCIPDRLKEGITLTRLLIFPDTINGNGVRGRQLFLNNNYVKVYPYIKQRVSAVVYLPTLKELVIASHHPNGVHFAKLDAKIHSTVKKSLQVNGLSVDEIRNKVFLTVSRPKKAISVMTLEGKDYKRVAILRYQLADIAADTKRSLLYVVRPQRAIYKFSYQGVNNGAFVLGVIGTTIRLDLNKDVLFYLKGYTSNIYKMSLADYSSIKMTNVGSATNTFCYHGNKVYVPNEHELLEITENGTQVKIETEYDKKVVDKLWLIKVP